MHISACITSLSRIGFWGQASTIWIEIFLMMIADSCLLLALLIPLGVSIVDKRMGNVMKMKICEGVVVYAPMMLYQLSKDEGAGRICTVRHPLCTNWYL